MNADPWDTLTAEMAADPPVTALGPDGGPVTVSGGVWEADTGVLSDVLRRAGDLVRLFGPEAAREVDDS